MSIEIDISVRTLFQESRKKVAVACVHGDGKELTDLL